MSFRYAVLTTMGNPMSISALGALSQSLGGERLVIVDPRGFSKKDWRVWSERTGIGRPENPWDLDALKRLHPDDSCLAVEHDSPDLPAILGEFGAEVGCNLDTSSLLPNSVIGAFPQGIVNVHPGALPEYPGSCAVEWALLEGKPLASTAHLMTSNLDAGPILYQEAYDFPATFNYERVRLFFYHRQAPIYALLLSRIAAGTNLRQLSKVQPLPGQLRKPISDGDLETLKAEGLFHHPSVQSATVKPAIAVSFDCSEL